MSEQVRKKLNLGQVDCHCHLSDPRILDLEEVIKRSQEKGVSHFLLAGVGPEDWERQEKLAQQFPSMILPCFGLHPYWVSDHSEEECEEALSILETKLSKSLGLGELGLDFREKIVKGKNKQQIACFEKQLGLSKKYNKAPVLHIVRAHDEAVKTLSKHHLREGIVHAFNSTEKTAKKYLDLGYTLSIGCALLHSNNHALQEAVEAIPLEKLLIESDSPDQPPPQFHEKNNESWTILLVAKRIAELKAVETKTVLSLVKQNLARIFFKEVSI